MDPGHKTRLRENRVKFVKEMLCTDVLLSHLQTNNTFTEEMSEEVLTEKTKQRKAATLLDILVRRGPNAFRTFCEALMESGQVELCRVLDTNFPINWEQCNNAKMPKRVYQPSDTSGSGPGIGEQPPEAIYTMKQQGTGLSDFGAKATVDDPMAAETSFITINVKPCDIRDERVATLLHSADVYKMGGKTRGRAIIISNRFFMKKSLTEREGAEFDSVNLDNLFTGLGFSTQLHEDKTAQDMADIILKESQNPEHCNADAFILFLMTHGARGAVYGIDGKSIKIEDEIATCFDAAHCPALKQKPKILFVQACQGKALTSGIPLSDAGKEEEIEIVKKLKELSIQDSPDSIPSFQNNTHEKADFIMAYSTVPGYKSWRRADLGSWFVRAICHVFSTYAHQEHITEMLTRVRNIIAEQKTISTGDAHYRQITETRETLLKKLYFFPGVVVEMRNKNDICDQ